MTDINLLLFNENDENNEPKKKKRELLKKLALAGGLAAIGGAAAVGTHHGIKKYGQYKAEKEYNRPINKFKRGAVATGKGALSGAKAIGRGVGSGLKSIGHGVGSLFKRTPKDDGHPTSANTTHQHIYIHDDRASNKKLISFKKPGFFSRHKGKIITGAALAGTAYAAHRVYKNDPEGFRQGVRNFADKIGIRKRLQNFANDINSHYTSSDNTN